MFDRTSYGQLQNSADRQSFAPSYVNSKQTTTDAIVSVVVSPTSSDPRSDEWCRAGSCVRISGEEVLVGDLAGAFAARREARGDIEGFEGRDLLEKTCLQCRFFLRPERPEDGHALFLEASVSAHLGFEGEAGVVLVASELALLSPRDVLEIMLDCGRVVEPAAVEHVAAREGIARRLGRCTAHQGKEQDGQPHVYLSDCGLIILAGLFRSVNPTGLRRTFG